MTKQQTMSRLEFGQRVRQSREKSGLTREEAAGRLSLSVRQIANYETGLTQLPPEKAHSMARVYNDPWLETTYCQCMCPITGCAPTVRLGAELMNALLPASMYDNERMASALRNVYEIMEDGVIDQGERIEFERSQQELELRIAQLAEVAVCVRQAGAQARR